jgi:hypothetical protein
LIGWLDNNLLRLHTLPITVWSEAGFGRLTGVVLVFVTAELAFLAAVLPPTRSAAES